MAKVRARFLEALKDTGPIGERAAELIAALRVQMTTHVTALATSKAETELAERQVRDLTRDNDRLRRALAERQSS